MIVAGLGAMGSAALDQLARRGVRVLGIDPFGVAHCEGSSGGDTRLIRQAYFEHPDYVPLLRRSYDGWRDLQDYAGTSLLYETGTLYLGPPDGDLIRGSRHSAAMHGLALETLDDAALRERFPRFRRPADCAAVFEPRAGFLLCEHAVRAQVARAVERGARLASGERVVSWSAESGGVRVETERMRYAAAVLVLALGSWSATVGRLALGLRVTRQPLFWVQPPESGGFALGRFPCWAVQRADAPGLFYGIPALPQPLTPRLGVKLAHHAPGATQDPDEPRAPAGGDELDAVLRAVADFLPSVAGPMTASRVCLYTMSDDGHFVVDRHPDHDNVVVACGFSGHGFKFAPVIGEVLADLATRGSTDLPVDFLRRR